MTGKALVLFDLDGVLSDDKWRIHYALDGKWADYFDRAIEDPVITDGRIAVAIFNDENHEIQYLTGRRVDMYQRTMTWLARNGFPNPERITMRGFADRDILAKYKAGVIKNALEGGEFESVHLFEDDPAVVNHVNSIWPGTATLVPWADKNPGMVKASKA
jgi:hypothetical protein